ncbi:MAG: hypothetical protein OEZ39_20275 [Gammaproteobacteria bacterium]|nr:hypothetical protein [Gammaproteobacteria bacterium]
MALLPGYSQSTINKNIATEVRAGKSKFQAAGIAYRMARAAWRKKHPTGAWPVHLKPKKDQKKKVIRKPKAKANPVKKVISELSPGGNFAAAVFDKEKIYYYTGHDGDRKIPIFDSDRRKAIAFATKQAALDTAFMDINNIPGKVRETFRLKLGVVPLKKKGAQSLTR